MRSPTCFRPCRICLIKSGELKTIPSIDLDKAKIDSIQWDLRSPNNTLSTVADVQVKHAHGVMEQQESRLKEIGATFYPVRNKKLII